MPDHVTIPINGGAHAIIDLADAPLIEANRWNLHRNGYAVRYTRINGRNASVYMHRVLLGLEYGDPRHTDHINRIRLDNRRANLRVVTAAENLQNNSGQPYASSQHRGVSRCNRDGRWRAYAHHEGKHVNLGRYDCELDAAAIVEAFRLAHLPFSIPIEGVMPAGRCVCRRCREATAITA